MTGADPNSTAFKIGSIACAMMFPGPGGKGRIPGALDDLYDAARYSERQLKEAEEAFRRNVDFKSYLHGPYKKQMGISDGKLDNSDLSRELMRDAYEEWLELGRPRRR